MGADPPAVVTFAAIGTTALVATADGAGLASAEAALRAELGDLDAACSRFRADSELTALNARAGRWTEVGTVLLDALVAAVGAAEATGGAVDPTIGARMRALGYDRDFADLDPDGPPLDVVVRPCAHRGAGAEAVPSWRRVQVDAARRRARIPAGVELDLGATAKAFAADRAAARAAEATGGGVLVSLGGDVATAGPPPPAGWLIRVSDDHARAPAPDDAHVRIRDGGLATSSTTVRNWRRGDRHLHHVLDPATGGPAEGPWRTATVAAATCTAANTASTAAIVLGDGARAWLEARSLPARLVAAEGRVELVAGWPDDTP